MSTLLAPIAMGILLVAAWNDIATRTIPDGLSLALIAVALLLRPFTDGLVPLGWSLAGALGLFLVLALLNARGILGGGDVKLAAAMACVLPLHFLASFLMATALAGGVVACVHLVGRLLPGPLPAPAGSPLLLRVFTAERWRIARRGSLPYAVAIAAGGWIVLLATAAPAGATFSGAARVAALHTGMGS
ncbi:MAG: prepilin peptidase [Rhodospirillales bacterium]|nr:prepilin peptidase [Rhodospirillales bacterium]